MMLEDGAHVNVTNNNDSLRDCNLETTVALRNTAALRPSLVEQNVVL